MILTRKCSLR